MELDTLTRSRKNEGLGLKRQADFIKLIFLLALQMLHYLINEDEIPSCGRFLFEKLTSKLKVGIVHEAVPCYLALQKVPN